MHIKALPDYTSVEVTVFNHFIFKEIHRLFQPVHSREKDKQGIKSLATHACLKTKLHAALWMSLKLTTYSNIKKVQKCILDTLHIN